MKTEAEIKDSRDAIVDELNARGLLKTPYVPGSFDPDSLAMGLQMGLSWALGDASPNAEVFMALAKTRRDRRRATRQ